MLMLKNNHLKMNNHNQTKTIFLKFCYFSLAILLFSCKADAVKKEKPLEINNVVTEVEKTEKNNGKKIIFFGDSLTAGYGLEDVENAFPGLIQRSIDSLHLNYTVVNSGISGETSSGGKNRIDWV